MLPTKDGITPVNLFSYKYKAFKFMSFPIEDGIFLVKKLDPRESSVRLTRFDIRVGMLPPIELPPSPSHNNWIERFVMELGSSPPSWLSLTSRKFNWL